ncbi:MAG: hypothetical protein ACOZQL_19575 [Myxococcota bacterium]
MGKAAKVIIDGLTKAKVPAALQARAKGLIDAAPDWDEAEAREIADVVRYVCGAQPELPALSPGFLEHTAKALLKGLSKTRTLDAWDLRALDVLARCEKSYWFWSLDSWLRGRVVAFPAEPIFEEAQELFRARGLWKREEDVIASLMGHLAGHLTDDGQLTSTGRWLLAQLDANADRVLRLAGEDVARLYRLLLAHRRPLFDRLLPTLQPKEDHQRSFLAEVLLDADAQGYEQAAVALMAGLKEPIPMVLSARNLVKHFAGKYRARVKELLAATLREKDVSFLFEGSSSSTREVAWRLAWKALEADEAVELWKTYEEENDAVRLHFYEQIAKWAKAKALPLLIDGLVYPKDPKVEYGFLNHAKYVSRMVALVKPFDLTPYLPRIEQAFAKNTNRKIREDIDALLGKSKQRPRGAKAVKPPSGKQGYRFDVYAATVVKAALAATKRTKQPLPSPIECVKLGGMQGQIRLETLILEGVGETVTLELSVPKTRVPEHCEEVDGALLQRFAARHGLEPDEVPRWGDLFELPWCALLAVQIEAAGEVAAGLKKQGHTLSKRCKVGVGEDDNFFDSAESFYRMTKRELDGLPKAQQADLLNVCFERVPGALVSGS